MLSFSQDEIADDQFIPVNTKVRSILGNRTDEVIERLTSFDPRKFALTETVEKTLIVWTTERNEEKPFLQQICELILGLRKVNKRQKKEEKAARILARKLKREEEERIARELEEAEARAEAAANGEDAEAEEEETED
jgi:hypothetical protein